ncbi:LPS export ABC transporter permease LptG [Sodalis endosymbiont of Henestaris halophilus]|uniref:LPS export ABC transporter permease LptG n=1 Tax=Sodalis endosymbiont of Henestaris halophilus TaxID=1929246 RepID=UPI000BBFC91A|nr:LPS export ABC transporter permease LptG [Sodalis endosymbiont of Henestaris halophilus]SNC59078.1 Lipopolysaccharide export system permease protein LptG [Sodalis endosymbiont of Henestaris halophilus]
MFSVLNRYVSSIIFNNIMITLFMLVSLSSIIKFVEQLRKVGQGDYSALGAGIFTLLGIFKDIEIFFPMAALLGALLGLGSLATRSELVVMQSSGFSRLKIASFVMQTAIFLVFLTIIIGEWIAPASEKIAYNYRTKAMYHGSIISTSNGMWIKDGNDFIFIEQVVSSDKLAGVNIHHFDKANRLQSLRYAANAIFSNNQWKLSKINEVDLTDCKQIISRQTLTGEWKTNLTPDKLWVISLKPNSLSISGMYHYVNYLKQNGQECNRYQLNMWSKIFLPFSVAVMMFMALSFIFGPLRSVTVGVRVVTGISIGFLFYILNKILGPLSVVYNTPPVIGALLPSMVFLIISIVLLLRCR